MKKMIKSFGYIQKEHFAKFKLKMKIRKFGNYCWIKKCMLKHMKYLTNIIQNTLNILLDYVVINCFNQKDIMKLLHITKSLPKVLKRYF